MEKYVSLIHDVINKFLTKLNNNEDVLILENNIKIDDSLKNHIVLNIISINKMNLDMSTGKTYVMQGDNYILTQKPEYYQLIVAFHSMFTGEKCLEGFKILSQISSFIDNNKKFSEQNVPNMLLENLSSISFVAKTFNANEENLIWQKLKIPYMPTLFYEVGLIPLYSPIKFTQQTVKPVSL